MTDNDVCNCLAVMKKKISTVRIFYAINSITMRICTFHFAVSIELPLWSARSGELVTVPLRKWKWRTEADVTWVVLVFFCGFYRLQHCHMEVENYEWWMWWVWFYSTSLLNFSFSSGNEKRSFVHVSKVLYTMTTIISYDGELCQNCSLEKSHSFEQAYYILDQQE